jgi:hypothetical protein
VLLCARHRRKQRERKREVEGEIEGGEKRKENEEQVRFFDFIVSVCVLFIYKKKFFIFLNLEFS